MWHLTPDVACGDLTPFRIPGMRRILGVAAILAATTVSTAQAASWKGIEPLTSRRPDVIRILGQPASENAADASMRFATREGGVIVSLTTRDFAARKGWPPALEGTVVQILLQHEKSKDTPKSLRLDGNPRFDREVRGESVLYRNRKDGIIRIFTAGKLTTSIYSPADGGPLPDD
jgi:hypothetical protein